MWQTILKTRKINERDFIKSKGFKTSEECRKYFKEVHIKYTPEDLERIENIIKDLNSSYNEKKETKNDTNIKKFSRRNASGSQVKKSSGSNRRRDGDGRDGKSSNKKRNRVLPHVKSKVKGE
jgi:hypothetical protein